MNIARTSIVPRALCFLMALCAISPALAVAETTKVTKLEVFPPDVQLTTSGDRQQIVVVATRPDGVTLDVTDMAQIKLADAKLARIENRTLYPLADGQTTLEVAYEGHKVQIPVKVTEAKTKRPVSFEMDVMSVFLRSGCNTGSCHGAARGKDGFMLSLFGYDPNGDHNRITRELGFRRINLAMPEQSMMLTKTTGQVPHTGGKLFDVDSEYYQMMLEWLQAGAPNDTGKVPGVVRLEIYPPRAVMEGGKLPQQMIARAVYTDGTDRDVTSLAVFASNNDNSAVISKDGLVEASNRGEAFITARFETHSVGSQVLVLPDDLQYTPPEEHPVNYIDELVNSKLRDLRIRPSELCTDEEFLRRVTLDVAGVLPTEQEYLEFLADKDPAKRSKLIDRLLERKEFSEIWAMKFAEILLVKSVPNQVAYKAALIYSNWLTDQISNNVPLNEIVKEMLASNGGTFTVPPTNYYQVQRDTLKIAENTAQVFMGIRTQCAQCHNHPFDRWTMNDYYSFAAFFSQVGRKTGQDYRESIVYNRASGGTRHPVTNQIMAPKFLGGETPDVKGKDYRQVLADWIVSDENPLFAPSISNRIWQHFFGIGIVDPVDDIRITNPPSNPELFRVLGEKLAEYNFDFKQLVRDICNSNAYQRSTVRNESNAHDELNFAHARVRRIRAESLLDCICQATEAPEKFTGLPLGARAVQIADGATTTYFLTTFGRSPRDTVCAEDAKTDPTLSQSLHLLNGTTVEDKIRRGAVIKRMLDAKKTPEEVVETLYVRCLSRRPTDAEMENLRAIIAQDKNPQQPLEDIFWALLNSREFIFNH